MVQTLDQKIPQLELIGFNQIQNALKKIPENNCSFYRDCLEHKFRCSQKNSSYQYPLKYGEYYCQEFVDNKKKLSKAGQKWITKTMLCLQESIQNEFQNNNECHGVYYDINGNDVDSYDIQLACNKIETFAFKSHPKCYTSPDNKYKYYYSICTLPSKDIGVVLATADINYRNYKELDDRYQNFYLEQLKDSIAICLRNAHLTLPLMLERNSQIFQEFEEEIPEVSAKELLSYERKIELLKKYYLNHIKSIDKKIYDIKLNRNAKYNEHKAIQKPYEIPKDYPHGSPRGIKIFKKNKTYEFTSDVIGSYDELIFEEGATVVLKDGANFHIRANRATFGLNSRIIGSGKQGKSQDQTPPSRPSQADYGQSGRNGSHGYAGESGDHASNVFLHIGINDSFENLSISVQGGAGGDGQPGGDAGQGGNSRCKVFDIKNGYRGGHGGHGGQGGYGGNGGNVTINWWRSGYDSFLKTDDEIVNSINVYNNGGTGGSNAVGGKKGKDGKVGACAFNDLELRGPDAKDGKNYSKERNTNGKKGELKLSQGHDKYEPQYIPNDTVKLILTKDNFDIFIEQSKKGKIDYSYKDERQNNILMLAAIGSSEPIFKEIVLNSNFDLEDVNQDNETALDIALNSSNLDAITFLINSGASFNKEDPRFLNAIEKAIELNDDRSHVFLNTIFKNGVSPDKKNKDGVPIVSLAALKKQRSPLSIFIKYNANLEMQDLNNETPIFYAISSDNLDSINLLIAKNINKKHVNTTGKSVLMHAAKKTRHLSILPKIFTSTFDLNQKDDQGRDAIFYGIQNDSAKVVIDLAELGFKLNQKDSNGTPLSHYAINDEMWGKFESNNIFGRELFLSEHGTTIDIAKKQSDAFITKLQFLKGSGIDLNERNGDDESLSVKFAKYGTVESLQDLRKLGVKFNVKSKDGESIRDTAIKYGNYDLYAHWMELSREITLIGTNTKIKSPSKRKTQMSEKTKNYWEGRINSNLKKLQEANIELKNPFLDKNRRQSIINDLYTKAQSQAFNEYIRRNPADSEDLETEYTKEQLQKLREELQKLEKIRRRLLLDPKGPRKTPTLQ